MTRERLNEIERSFVSQGQRITTEEARELHDAAEELLTLREKLGELLSEPWFAGACEVIDADTLRTLLEGK